MPWIDTPETDKYRAESQEYLGQVATKNEARRQQAKLGLEKPRRKVDVNQPALSEQADLARQYRREHPEAVQEHLQVNPPERTGDPKYPPSGTPQLSRERQPGGWQGQPTPPPSRPDTRHPVAKAVDEFLNKRVFGPLETGMGYYEKYLGKPFRESMYKEDPLETMAKRAPGPEATPGEKAWHATKEAGLSMLLDPLGQASIGLGLARPSLPASPQRVAGTPQGPVTAPHSVESLRTPATSGSGPGGLRTPGTQGSLGPAQPSIQELAQAHQEKLLGAQTGPRGAGAGGPGLTPQGIQPPVEQIPTGSVVRPQTSVELPSTEYTGVDLTTTPTGSLVRVSKPPVEEAAVPRGPIERNQPLLPAERTGPTTPDLIPESKMLHGLHQDLPPKPPLASAEDLLARQLAGYEQRSSTRLTGPTTPMEPGIGSKVLPTLSSDPVDPLLQQPRQAGPASNPVPVTGEKMGVQADLPSSRIRALHHAYDVMDQMGPYTRRLSDIFRYSSDYSEQGTRQNFLDYVQMVQGLVQKPGLGSRLGTKTGEMGPGTVASKLDPFLNPTAKDLGLTQKQIDAIYELNEVGGDVSKVTEKAKAELPINDPVVQQIHKNGWKIATGRASSEPGIQLHAAIYDPITGESTKVGPPGPFNPHLPMDMKTKTTLTDEMLKKFFVKGHYEEKGYTLANFKELMKKWWYSDDPTIQFRKYAGVDYKRYLDILEDAKSHGRTAAESARFYGYETDPLRILVRYNQGALKRAKMLEYGDEIKGIFGQLGKEYGENSPAYKWVELAHNRTQGIGLREDLLRDMDWFGKVQSVMYPSWLKFSWLQNIILQPTYGVMHTGPTAVAKALWQHYGAKIGLSNSQIEALAQRSGANFPSFFAKYNRPDGILAQYNKTMNEANLFALSDNFTRLRTGEVAIPHIESVAKNLWRQPQETKWRGLLREANINPEELLERMRQNSGKGLVDGDTPRIPEEYLLRGAQVIANRSMGRTGIQALPLWATGDTMAHKAILMLQRQLLSNSAAVHRLIFNAPTTGLKVQRGLTLMFGAVIGGHIYQVLKNWIQGRFPDDPGITLKQAMGKLGVRGERQQAESAFFVKSLLNGVGTFNASLMLSGLNMLSGNINAGTIPTTPAASSFSEDILKDIMHGKLKEAGMRLQPLPIPPALYQDKKKTGGAGLPQPPKPGWQ